MRLARLRLRNFRCYKDEFSVTFGEITALIGKNDAGKSSVLDALAVFFDEAKLDADDGCVQGDRGDVRIICEFDDLPDNLIVDRNFKTTLPQEYLVNADGRLEVHKVYDGSLKTPKAKPVLIRANHPTGNKINDLLSLKNADLQARAAELHVNLSTVDRRVNSQLRQAIWHATGDPALSLQDIPVTAETGKQVWDQLQKELPVFALFKSDRQSTDQDDEAQNPLKAAINEALKAKDNELQQICDYVRQEVTAIAEATVEKIREMDPTLATQLRPRFGSLNWNKVFSISLTGDDDVPINKRGSGVRRMILLNFLRAKAEQRAGDTGVIYAIEELETSQHPNNQKLLLEAFAELAERPNCQVILTTHTPTLAHLLPLHAMRYLSVEDSGRRVLYQGEGTAQRVAESLGVLADHNVGLFIGVEGKNDESFLKIISRTLCKAGEEVPDLDEAADAGRVVFFPLGGENLALWTSRLRHFNRPEYHIYDRDVEPKTTQHQRAADAVNVRDRCCAVLTGKREMENYLHPTAIRAARREIGPITFSDDDNVPLLVARAVHEAAPGAKPWAEVDEKTRGKKESAAKSWLNTDAVCHMTAPLLSESDPRGDIRKWLQEIGQNLRE